ncbi:MAG TPA: type II secretion system F family protein [Acidimicrobiia bacterium]|nr:type II secretion system F family protein [Acidimicrobiia bacterium]
MRVVAAALGTLVGGLPLGLVGGLLAGRVRRRQVRPSPDVVRLGSVLLVLVGSGMPLITALSVAAEGDPATEAVVRRSRRLGTAAALAGASGPLAPLLHRLANAAVSGAAPEQAIRAFIDAERRRRHTEAVERARRLPVRLMIPLTLLVLPGFVLMVYGPAFISLTHDLLGPLVP